MAKNHGDRKRPWLLLQLTSVDMDPIHPVGKRVLCELVLILNMYRYLHIK